MKILKPRITICYLKGILHPKKNLITTLILALFFNNFAFSQTLQPHHLGNEQIFSKKIMTNTSAEIVLELPGKKIIKGKVTLKKGTTDNYKVIGLIDNNPSATFVITKTAKGINGHLVLMDEKKAYEYTSDANQEVVVKEMDIDKLLCIGYPKNSNDAIDTRGKKMAASLKVPTLQSLPGAVGTVYLDFDGEVVSGTRWAGGRTIDAQSPGYSDEQITNIWRIVSEDYRPFNLNVTTDRSVYNAAPGNKRILCIFTTTTTAQPDSGGVAILGSFARNSNDPCWVFNKGVRAAGETASHEVGHTLGLGHDGIKGGTEYYGGHGQWSPIMGWSASRAIGQWSKGEYNNPKTTQDDLAIISGPGNGVGYRKDDYGNIISEASELKVSSDGTVDPQQNEGLIATQDDKDMFSFVTAGGEVRFDFKPDPYYPNLNIQARILDALGDEVAIDNPFEDLSASITTTLAGGTYFIEIDGAGEGSVSNGYSDYASLGFYSISGSYAPGNNNQPPVANFEAVVSCGDASFQSTAINTVDSYLWDFGDGTTSAEQNPNHTYTRNGQYTVTLVVTNTIGSDTIVRDNVIDVKIPLVPDTATKSICMGESTTLTLSGSTGYLWYDQQTGGDPIATGNNYETSQLSANTTYYVSGTSNPITTATVGLTDIDPSAGGFHNGGFYLIFDAKESLLLKKAKVSAEGAGNRTLELRSASGELLTSKVISIANGEQIIDINLNIPAGNDLQIGFATGAKLFRNNRNAKYPYEVSDVLSIKRSTSTEDPTGYYYYLYDWQIGTLGGCETTERTVVTINTVEAPEKPILSLVGGSEITSNRTYAKYQWYRDGVLISDANGKSYSTFQKGEYTLFGINEAGCSSPISNSILIQTLSTDTVTALDKEIMIFPNPTNGELHIKGLNSLNQVYDIRILNTSGQTLLVYDQVHEVLNVQGLADGLYFIIINNKIIRKFQQLSR